MNVDRRRFVSSLLRAGASVAFLAAFVARARAKGDVAEGARKSGSIVKEPKAVVFADAGEIPNSRLPLLVYPGAMPADADEIEAAFRRNGWSPAWRYSVYPFPHYHSTSHEVLGVYRGSARIRLGHGEGSVFEVKAGDVIVIPAGVGHENIGASDDFHVVGGYPPGMRADLLRGRAGERPAADERIARVPLPESDPVNGKGGPLVELWRKAAGLG